FYFYKIILAKGISSIDLELRKAEASFDESLVKDMQSLDKRVKSSKEVLSQHIIVSPILQVLGDLTLRTVRYTKFQYSYSREEANKIEVNMSGQASSYRAIAIQAALLGGNKNILNPVFSNLTLDDRGRVLFDLSFSVDQNFLNYEQSVAGTIQVN
ncbi:MAG: hypothetical protein US50_C0029G0009, partial [Candidatus Nomurabacteria bacterium GW2011_GWB1_37_5]